MNMKKILAFALCLVLVAGLSVAGTLAWLQDKTETITNTFTVGKIDITLTETFNKDTDGDKENDAWENKIIPGQKYVKDPVVTVLANSEECYLFVKFEENEAAKTYLTYTSNLKAPDWTQGDDNGIPSNVWYRTVAASTKDQKWELLDGNKVTVNSENVTTDTMSAAAAATLSYTAYAVQTANVADVAAAWTIANTAATAE